MDAYIAKSADFAKPILRHLRKVVHAGCPGVEETLKWSHQWVTEARTGETRERRLETAVKWMAEGKTRNWKYDRKRLRGPRPRRAAAKEA
jgi:hypothetical protein